MRTRLLLMTLALAACQDSTTPTAPAGYTVQITGPSQPLRVREQVQLTAEVRDDMGSVVPAPMLIWSTNKPEIATVTSTGLLSALAPGRVVVTASTGGNSASLSLDILAAPPALLTISAPSDSIRVGKTLGFSASVRALNGDRLPTPPLTWSVDAPAVASINSSGLLTALTPGRVHVAARAGDLHAAFTVEVLSIAPSMILLTSPESTMRPGATLQLSASVTAPLNYPLPNAPVTWGTDRSDIVSINQSGRVTAVSPGTAKLSATSGSATASLTITVLPSIPGALQVTGLDHTLHPGDQVTLRAVVTSTTGLPMPTAEVTWQSSQPSVATVSPTGLLSAVAPGAALVTATAGSASGPAYVLVLGPPGTPVPGQGLIAFFRATASDTSLEVRTGEGTLLVSSKVHPVDPTGDGTASLSIHPSMQFVSFDCAPQICNLAVPGGTVTPLPLPSGDYRHPAWFAAGQEMFVEQGWTSLAHLDVPGAAVVPYRTPFYANAPIPSPTGEFVLYQCDYLKQYDDPADLCLLQGATGAVTLFHWGASAASWSTLGSVAYTRMTTDGRSLVIEPFQSNRDPVGPGAQEYSGFEDVTATAWSPDASRLAMVRNGKLWIASMPGVTNPVEIAHVEGTTIFGLSWR